MGYALTTVWEGSEAGQQQVIGFDMGGTSTDVSRYAGSYEHVFESTTAGAAPPPTSGWRRCSLYTYGRSTISSASATTHSTEVVQVTAHHRTYHRPWKDSAGNHAAPQIAVPVTQG